MSDAKKVAFEGMHKKLGEDFIVSEDNFKTPSMEDYHMNAIDSVYFRKIEEMLESKKGSDLYRSSFYIEAPNVPGLRLGKHDRESAYFIKARPDLSKDAQELGNFDADTLYFPIDSIDAGSGNGEVKDEIINMLKNSEHGRLAQEAMGNDMKFGLRFLAIDAPEIPKYSFEWVDLKNRKRENKKIKIEENKKYGEVKGFKDKYFMHKNNDRLDTDTLNFISFLREDPENLIVWTDELFDWDIKKWTKWTEYTEAKPANPSKEDQIKIDEGKTRIKMLTSDGSNPNTVKAGLNAQILMKKIIEKAGGEVYLLIDRTSLNRVSATYPSKYKTNPFDSDAWNVFRIILEQFTGDYNAYKYSGLNYWGMDGYSRFLGTPYLRVKENGVESWINLSKYLIAEGEKIKVHPDYSGSPLTNDNYNFVSRAFKLETYDFNNRVLADVTNEVSKTFDDRRDIQKELFKGTNIDELKDWSVMIGDSMFMVPPTSIRTITQTTSERIPVVRAKGSIAKGAVKSEKTIEMTLYFNEEEGINGKKHVTHLPKHITPITYYMNGLRALISQFKFTPFLPIESSIVNKVFGVEAVTLVGMQIGTLPNYPKCISAVLTLQEFDYRQYMPEIPSDFDENMDYLSNPFANTINFQVMRWYYQRALINGENLKKLGANSREYLEATYGNKTALVPMEFKTPKIDIYLADMEHLDKMLQVKRHAMKRPDATVKLRDSDRIVAAEIKKILDKVNELIKDDEILEALDKIKYGDKTINDTLAVRRYPDKQGKTQLEFSRVNSETIKETKSKSETLADVDNLINIMSIKMYEINQLDGEKVFISNIEPIYEHNDLILKSKTLKANTTQYGDVIIGVKFKVELSMASDSEISELKRGASLSIELDEDENPATIDKIFVNREISVRYKAIVRSTNNENVRKIIPPYLMSEHENSKLQLDTDHMDMKFLGYCGDVANEEPTPHPEVVEGMKQAVDIDELDTVRYNIFEPELLRDGLIRVTNITASFGNVYNKLSTNGTDGYAPQYMGGQDTMIEVNIETTEEKVVAMFQALPSLCTKIAREYRLVIPSSPIKIDSEISKLLGVNEVLIENLDVATVPNHPGLYHISIRFISIDRTLRNREALQKIGIEDPTTGRRADSDREEFRTRDFFDIQDALSEAEVYPDLELPSIIELESAGFEFIRHRSDTKRIYPDPDFYFVYGHILTSTIYRETIESIMKSKMDEYNWEDQENGKITTKVTKEDEVIKITESNDIATKSKEQLDALRDFSDDNKEAEEKAKYNELNILNKLDQQRLLESWDISKDIKVIFLEKPYLSLLEDYKNKKSEEGKWVYDALENQRNASKLIGDYLNKIPKELTGKVSFKENMKSSHSKVKSEILKMLKDNELKKILEMLNIERTQRIEAVFFDLIFACACASTSEEEYFQKKKEDKWHPKQDYLGIKITKDQTFSDVKDIEDAGNNGVEIGAFKIKMYTKDEIKGIANNENLKFPKFKGQQGTSLNKTHYLLDPFFRKENTKIEDIINYKKKCAVDFSFCTKAFLRIVLFMIKKMIDENMIPNISIDLLKSEMENEMKEEKKDVGAATQLKLAVIKAWQESIDDITFWNKTIDNETRGNSKTEIEEMKQNNEKLKKYIEFIDNASRAINTGKIFVASVLALISADKNYYDDMKDRNYPKLNATTRALKSFDGSNKLEDKSFKLLRKMLLALVGLKTINTQQEIGKNLKSPIAEEKQLLNEKVYIEATEDPKTYIKDSFHDMVVNDKRGRMARAFPTFYMIFIDEGKEIGLWKLSDNFYSINSIAEIQIMKSRKIAADTARIVMSNFFHTFTTEDEDSNPNYRYDWRDIWTSIFNPGLYHTKQQEMRFRQQPINRAKLTPGTRIHIRMGYGSNAATLPIVFNGVMAEVSAGEVVEVIAQGDGVELTNPILLEVDGDEIANKDSNALTRWIKNSIKNGVSPKTILDGILTTHGGWYKKFIRDKTNGFFYNSHPFGITHFGDPRFDVIFKNGEATQNIYEAISQPKWGDLGSEISKKYSMKEAPKISMEIFGKSFWDILHVCASVSPDFTVGVVPFGFRSTVFHGHPRFYYAYDYERDIDGIIYEKRKPFQQYHIYTSQSDIIKNDVRATSAEMKTCAIGLYDRKKVTNKSQHQVGPMWVDWDIYSEEQKTMTVDTQLYAKGIPGLGRIPVLRYFSVLMGSASDDEGIMQNPAKIAWRMTVSALKNSVKDMYQGELIVVGDPCVKPQDRIFMHDTYEDMSGAALVEGCVHNFSATNGFTTTIYPDCIAVHDDRHELAVQTLGGHTAWKAVVVGGIYTAIVLLAGKTTSPPLAFAMNSIAGATAKSLTTIAKIGANETFFNITGQTGANLASKVGGLGTKVTGLSKTGIKGLALTGGAASLPAIIIGALTIGTVILSAKTVYNIFERWAASKQVLQVFPLKKYGRVMTAGLNGSKGLVYGSPTYEDAGTFKSTYSKWLIGEDRNPALALAIDLIASNEMRDIAERYNKGNRDAPAIGSAMGNEFLSSGLLESMTSEQSKKVSGYKRHLLDLRINPKDENYTEKMASIIEEFGLTDTDAIETQSRIVKENDLILSDDIIKEYYEDMKLFKIYQYEGKQEQDEFETKHLEISGENIDVPALIETEGNKKIYDIPLLKKESLDVLRNIIARTEKFLPAKEVEKRNSTEEFVCLLSALRVGDADNMSCTGYCFVLKACTSEGEKNTSLESAIMNLEDEVAHFYETGPTRTEKLFIYRKIERKDGDEFEIIVLPKNPAR